MSVPHGERSRGKRILIVLGTRPEAIKLAPLVAELRARGRHEVEVCLSGQHRSMVDGVMRFFGTSTDHDLAIMSADQSLAAITSRALEGLDSLLAARSYDWVIVQGDTTTSFVGALAAFYRSVRIAHVEAGLRTGRRTSPFPEEMNRVLTSRLADLHFAPTRGAIECLRSEGVPEDRIHLVGNTGIDALFDALRRMPSLGMSDRYVARHRRAQGKRMILVTGHRRESFGAAFREICLALRDLAEEPRVHLVYPVHLNPNVRATVFDLLRGRPNVSLIDPVEYPELVWLAQQSYFILTDSGGIQEEAAALGKPVLVMREVTERAESVDAGISRVVGTGRSAIVRAGRMLLGDEQLYRAMARALPLYGDGTASRRIADVLETA
jgi:UDP-N-acetylglucosamine 2-epimerase (non-hydrolysing)